MKKYFISGLAISLPILLTFLTLNFLINLITHPFLASVEQLLGKFHLFEHSVFFFQGEIFVELIGKTLILLLLIGFVILTGFLTQLFFIKTLFHFGNSFLRKLPFINKIYPLCQEVIQNLFNSQKFNQVVFAPFPSPQYLTLAFVANSSFEDENFLSVFVPGTPNPSVGFLLLFEKKDLHFVDMTVDEAMKFILSCGIVMPNFKEKKDHGCKSDFLPCSG